MERMEHIRGRLIDGEDVILEDVDGYLASHESHSGKKTLYGYFEMPSERLEVLSPERCYRLLLSDGRKANIYAEVVPSNAPGNSIAQFHVTGAIRK